MRSYWGEIHQRAIREAMHALSIDEGARGVITVIVAIGVIALVWILGGSNDAGHELIIRCAATAIIILFFPFIYLWKFVSLPARLHAETVDDVKQLGDRLDALLQPRIRVFLEEPEHGVHGYACTDGSFSKYVQFTVTPETGVPLIDCEARLESVERVNDDGTAEQLVEEQIFCRWSNHPVNRIDIRPKTQHRANIFFVNDRNEDEMHVETIPVKVRLPVEIQTKGDYRIRVNVSAKECPTEIATFMLHWGGFDDLSIAKL